MNLWTFGGVLLAIAVGGMLPLQALINARLGQVTSGALFASFSSFLIGTLVLGAAMLATRTALPNAQSAATQPAWLWVGGAIGAFYVLSATVLVPRLGAAGLICLVVLGQMVGSLLLDHYGVLNAARSVDGTRILGATLVVAGAILVVRPQAG